MSVILNTTYNAMSNVVDGHITMLRVSEHPIINIKILNLLQYLLFKFEKRHNGFYLQSDI